MQFVFWPGLQVSFLLLLSQTVIKALFTKWRVGKICFHLAEILHQDGGCVSGAITDAQNLLTYVRQKRGQGRICGRKAH